MMFFIRSTIFNILFYSYTAFSCIVLLPSLLMPRAALLKATRFYLTGVAFLEKYVMGLTYEVRGLEHLPKSGTYIVAAKHQSAYETLKLHHLLGDPTIVLKKELMSIPLFGFFLRKLDVIAINRDNKESSINSIIEGAKRMRDQNRPILIFPQGTRVATNATTKEKPYKGGIAKMYSHADLKIIPMALNSGLFWGRNSYLKKPGVITFEFLPPIEAGLPDKEVMKVLQDNLEEKSNALMAEANLKYPYLNYVPALPKPTETPNQNA